MIRAATARLVAKLPIAASPIQHESGHLLLQPGSPWAELGPLVTEPFHRLFNGLHTRKSTKITIFNR